MAKDYRSISFAVICALLLMSGCDWLRPGGPPDEALIEISSADAEQATFVLSQSFEWVEDSDCAGEPGCGTSVNIISADTSIIDLPYSTTIKFTSTQQLMVETYPVGQDTARIGMRILIDGTEKYNAFKLLVPPEDDEPRETMFYVYQFGGRPLNPGVVGEG